MRMMRDVMLGRRVDGGALTGAPRSRLERGGGDEERLPFCEMSLGSTLGESAGRDKDWLRSWLTEDVVSILL